MNTLQLGQAKMSEQKQEYVRNRKHRRSSMADSMVQGRLLTRTAMHWGIFLLLTTALTVTLGILSGDPKLSLSQLVAQSLQSVVWPTITLLALLPAFLVDTLRLSSRFVGPMVRLRRSLQNLGYLQTADKIAFRENDFWQQSADDFNAVLDLVESQKQKIEELEKQLVYTAQNRQVRKTDLQTSSPAVES